MPCRGGSAASRKSKLNARTTTSCENKLCGREYWCRPLCSKLCNVLPTTADGCDACREPLGDRKTLISVDTHAQYVMELPDPEPTAPCSAGASFQQKWGMLSSEDRSKAFVVTKRAVMKTAESHVACVGCRHSVEQLLHKVSQSRDNVLGPLNVYPDESVGIDADMGKARVASLFSAAKERLCHLQDTQPAGRRNRRCALHSLEPRANNNWLEIWLQMSAACQKEATMVCAAQLQTALDKYVQRHRFCAQCKQKVQRALDTLLSGEEPELECDREEFLPELYHGLNSCHVGGQIEHIHMDCDVASLAQIISFGQAPVDSAERHAKTFDSAQEEVLACLGELFLTRLQRLGQQMLTTEKAWLLLFNVGLEAVRNSFEVAVDNKQGAALMEKFLLEETCVTAEELQRDAQRREKKKAKRKKNKKAQQQQQQEQQQRQLSSPTGSVSSRDSFSSSPDTTPVHSPTASPPTSTRGQQDAKGFDTAAEIRLLSSMGWDCSEDVEPVESDEFALTEEEIRTAMAKLAAVSKPLRQQRHKCGVRAPLLHVACN
eukprot:m.109736 g.109736  ORF g.109736 m.109736 type:complete len:546 (-) comp15994_c4_seq2:122-1759(-)